MSNADKTIYYTKKLLRKAEAVLQNLNIKLCKSYNFAKQMYMLVIPTGKTTIIQLQCCRY